GDAQMTRRLVAQLAECGDLGIHLVEPRAGDLEQPLAGLGRRNATRGTVEQANPEPLLKRADCLAQRGLRDAELRGSAREAFLAGDGEKGDDVAGVVAVHL